MFPMVGARLQVEKNKTKQNMLELMHLLFIGRWGRNDTAAAAADWNSCRNLIVQNIYKIDTDFII